MSVRECWRLTGVKARRDRLLGIQAALEELDVEWNMHPMVNPLVCCPRCGEEKLEPYEHPASFCGLSLNLSGEVDSANTGTQ